MALVTVDAAAILLSWMVDLLVQGRFGGWPSDNIGAVLAILGASTIAALGLLASQRLYLARVCSTKAIEVERLFRVAVLFGFVGAGVIWLSGYTPSVTGTLLRTALAFVFLALGRSLYRGWLGSQRTKGRFARPVLIVGANEDASAWCKLLDDHPELGLSVSGMVSDDKPPSTTSAPWLGPVEHLKEITRATGATGAMVAATAFSPSVLNSVIRDLLSEQVHVHVSNGLRGIALKRLTPTSVARESLFYVEKNILSEWQLRAKRALDLLVATLALLITAPLLALSALAIKLCDRGPVLFKQERVGRDGKLFTVYKLRTMVVDAESRKAGLASINQRTGPLFKLDQDPRTTPVGRFLRASSLDELPQFVNVLQGHMSVVGPRPALPSEVAQFGDELLARHEATPGITGLWQLEARDNPSFDSYLRLDLHYVENWSILLDLAIMISTVASVVTRGMRALVGADRGTPLSKDGGAPLPKTRLPEPVNADLGH